MYAWGAGETPNQTLYSFIYQFLKIPIIHAHKNQEKNIAYVTHDLYNMDSEAARPISTGNGLYNIQ